MTLVQGRSPVRDRGGAGSAGSEGLAFALIRESAEDLGRPVPGPSGDGGTDGLPDAEASHVWRDEAVVLAVARAWQAGDASAVRAIAGTFDTLLQYVPAADAGGVRLARVGVAERRRRGSFATPPKLAEVLARHALPDPEDGVGSGVGSGVAGRGTGPAGDVPRVVDPACGAGALLRAGFTRLRGLGVPAGPALAALHGVDADPAAVAVCRAVLAVDATEAGHPCTPEDLVGAVRCGDALAGPVPALPAADVPVVPTASGGFTWHEAFPGALDVPGGAVEPVTGWRGGFVAVIANPPWERLKVGRREWDGAPPAQLREARADASRALREAGRHPLTGVGELNAYLPFVETSWRLLGPAGRAGIVVPAGIASDRSAARLLEALLDTGTLALLHLLSPGAIAFRGVSARIGVAVLALRGGPHRGGTGTAARSGGPSEVAAAGTTSGPEPVPGPGPASGMEAQVIVGVDDLDADVRSRAWSLRPGLSRLVNPNTGTPPLCGSARDADLLADAHRRWPVLRRRTDPARDPTGGSNGRPDRAGGAGGTGGSGPGGGWQVRLVTPLHMTRDARWFRPGPGPGLVPLWEAKHAGLLDHRGGSAQTHRYWVPAALVQDRYGDLAARGWLAGYRNVTTVDAPRTLLPCALPVAGVGNSFPLLSAPRLPLLLAALASLPVDYLVRQKHAGANLNFFKLEQAAVPPPEAYDRPAPWRPGPDLGTWVLY
ncbi:MAG: hypothetical protein P8Z68_09825 [Kineosporiaceae bacterium]